MPGRWPKQAQVQESYSEVLAPVSGRVNVWAARQGEVVAMGAPIVTIMDLTQTWVYAPLPETQADAVQAGRLAARRDARAAQRSRARSSTRPRRRTLPRSAT